jgi:hypothetical protein
MADADEVRNAKPSSPEQGVKLAEDLERRRQELVVFRDAGILTESELEEQMAKLRWGLP